MGSTRHKKLHVIIIENNQLDSKMLQGMLSKSLYGSFRIETVSTLALAFQVLAKNHFDVVLLDLNLKDSKGLVTLQKVAEHFPRLPIVVNTGAYEDDIGLKAVTSGAQDYLIKGQYLPYGLSKSLYYAVERKKAELEVAAAYERLKETQAQLIQIEKMNIVGGVASGVAHEVKNPLATIIYGAEYLESVLGDSIENDNIGSTLSSIIKAANKANSIIRDLLDFAGLSVMPKKNEDVNSVVDQSLVFTNHQCVKYGIKVLKKYANDLPRIKVEKNRVEQVIVDLVLNSIHAMREGGTLTISTSLHKYSKHYVGVDGQSVNNLNVGDPIIVVDIDDTGDGIKEENLAKIFDPFFTTRRAAGGVGLGLSIARTIMNSHHGLLHLGNLDSGHGARARLIFKA
ncbi:MAG: response regulator [Candidatus Omnitrophica bacterium]|nr:response regulator [Candidatus Omnitrophota bacterium]